MSGAAPNPSGVRRVIGCSLLAICALAWAGIVLLPFIGVSLAEGAALGVGLVVVGEGAFLVGVALLGKEIVNKLRALVGLLRDRTH